MRLNEIDTTTPDGQMLFSALAALTVSPAIMIDGKELNGRQITPDGMLELLEPVRSKIFDTNDS